MTSPDKSTRHHRRKRLCIQRAAPSDLLKTPPPPTAARHDISPRGLSHALHRASPLERERRRILSVELRDIAHEVEHRPVKTPRRDGMCRTDERPLCTRPPPAGLGRTPLSAEDPSCTVPAGVPALMPPYPKEVPGWGLVPLFNSVRSKLESFAEIFLTPVKSRRDCPGAGELDLQQCPGEERPAPGDLCPAPGDLCPAPGDLCPAPLPEDGTTEDTAPYRTPPNHRLQPSTLCRPPLHRYLSSPVLPLHKRRHSLDTAVHPAEPCTCRRRQHSLDTAVHPAEPCTCRRRRHSLGSLEECRNLVPLSLSCLRKENHPSVLSLHPPGDPRSVLGEGSPTGRCSDQDQVTPESGPESDYKTPGKRSKENKVSNIQIRKRAMRQEGTLTPLGLPKRVRLQKEDFSLEEIYTNKNYRTPTEKRKFETIFEEPIMKGGALILTSQRPLRRIMVFKEGGSAPRKRRKKGKAAGRTRRCPAPDTQDQVNYELLLQHKLKQLEAALQEEGSEP